MTTPIRTRLRKIAAGRPFVLAGVILAISATLACVPDEESSGSEPWVAPLAPTSAAFPTLEPAANLTTAAITGAPTPLPTVTLASPDTAIPAVTRLPVSNEASVPMITEAEAEAARGRYEGLLRSSWDTDFMRTTISFDEIMTGGPPKDGIPAIDDPQFESIADADAWLDDLEPVQVVDLNGDVRAYPVQVMVWHELVNDTVGGEPVVITF